MIYKYRSESITQTLKSIDDLQGIVEGYFSATDVKDSYGDIMKKGVYGKSITERGPASVAPRIKHFFNHDVRLPVGKLMELSEDAFGLRFVSKVGTHQAGRDYLKMYTEGIITEHSIGFEVIDEEWSKDLQANIIKEVRLWEGSSLSGWGVNQYTPVVGVKGFTHGQIEDQVTKMEKFVRSNDLNENTIDLLLIQLRQYGQLITDLTSEKSVTKPDDSSTTSPTAQEKQDQAIAEADAMKTQLQLFNSKLSWTLQKN